MHPELLTLVPRDKHDLHNANAVVALGWPAVEPIASQLMEWVQDSNWPVAQVLAPFLATVGSELAPHVRQVLGTSDDTWKYFVIQDVVARSSELARALQAELRRLALEPTPSERTQEVDLVARAALEQLER